MAQGGRSIGKVVAVAGGVVLIAGIGVAWLAWRGPDMRSEDIVRLPGLDSIGASQWEKLAACRVYFGHQSVGLNILEGVKDLMQENAVPQLRIIETDRA